MDVEKQLVHISFLSLKFLRSKDSKQLVLASSVMEIGKQHFYQQVVLIKDVNFKSRYSLHAILLVPLNLKF